MGVGAAKRVSLWGAAESGAGTGWPGRLPPPGRLAQWKLSLRKSVPRKQ